MESSSENPPKKPGFKLRIIKDKAISDAVDDFGLSGQVKELVKSRLAYETQCLQAAEKQLISIVKMAAENDSNCPQFEEYMDKYVAEFRNEVALKRSLVAKLSEAEGPYERMKRWMEAPTTKSQPEEWHRQYSFIRLEHAKIVSLMKKERATMTKIYVQLRTCRLKMRELQSALRIELNLDVNVSAQQIKQHRALKGTEQELMTRREKSLQQYEALLIEEEDIRQCLIEDVAKITGEMDTYNMERLKVTNDTANKFAWILNQQEVNRREKRQATFDLVIVTDPKMLPLPQGSVMSETKHVVLYKFPNFAEQLKDIKAILKVKTPTQETAPVIESQDTTAASSSKDSEFSSTKPSSYKDTEHSSKKSSRSKVSDDSDITDREARKSTTRVEEDLKEQSKQEIKASKTVKVDEKPQNNESGDADKIAPPSVTENHPSPSSSDEDSDDSVQEHQQEKDQDIPAPPPGHGVPLKKSQPLKALLRHKVSDKTYLSFKKGQKLVQTHKANEEGIAYGYTRKHSYSKIKYGYFSTKQMRTWKSTPKNILKNLLT